MAFESRYWRKNIKQNIKEIRKLMSVNINSLKGDKFDEAFSKVEINLFMMAFSIRKLIETRKIPDPVLDQTIQVTVFKRNNTRASWSFDFDKLYDFSKETKDKLKLKYFLNQIMHSYVFQISATRKGNLAYLYFVSDTKRRDCLYYVKLDSILKFIEKIYTQEVKYIETKYDEKIAEFVTKTR